MAQGNFRDWINTIGDVAAYGPTICDTHANRLQSNPTKQPFYPPGKFLHYFYFETDRGVLYVSWINNMATVGVPAWYFLTGRFYVSSLSLLPTDLGLSDTGFQAVDTTLCHEYVWSGTAWKFSPTEPGSNFYQFTTDGNPPKGFASTAWHVADGSSQQVSQGDGTTSAVTLLNLNGGSFVVGANAVTGVNPATSPTWAGGSKTDADSGAGTVVQSGTGVTVAAHTHQHPLSNANAVINPPSAANGGLPQNVGVVWYCRL